MHASQTLVLALLSLWVCAVYAAIYAKPEYCCVYCRSDTRLWVTLGSTFDLSADAEETKMASPAAYLIHDVEEARFQIEGRDYKLHYAGAPLSIQHVDLSDPDKLISDQYFQVDLATPKPVGGVITQGGFYEERIQGLFPPETTWVSRYAISYSNVSTGFDLLRDHTGNTKIFDGNSDASSLGLNAFDSSLNVRYVRFHPLRGHNKDGVISNVNVRMSVITCAEEICLTQKINCLMSSWEEWSQCACSESSCSYRRKREIVRVQACGGARCGSLSQIEACVPPEPIWKSVLQYIGIGLATIVVIIIGGMLIARKTQKNRVEVIVVQSRDDEEVLQQYESEEEDEKDAEEFKHFENNEEKNSRKFSHVPQMEMVSPPPYSAEFVSYGLADVD